MADAESPLDAYRWQNRIVIVFAGADATEQLAQQRRMLASNPCGLQDRDVLVVTVEDDSVAVDGIPHHAMDADRLRAVFDVPEQGYVLLLVGKDGGVKLRLKEPVAAEDLFALIDGMPMRQREMQRRSKSKP